MEDRRSRRRNKAKAKRQRERLAQQAAAVATAQLQHQHQQQQQQQQGGIRSDRSEDGSHYASGGGAMGDDRRGSMASIRSMESSQQNQPVHPTSTSGLRSFDAKQQRHNVPDDEPTSPISPLVQFLHLILFNMKWPIYQS
jgi:hypothetical protein